MEVIYKKKRIRLSFQKCIVIEFYKSILRIKRFWRRLQLLFDYFKKYIVILLCVIIYISITTILGIEFNRYKNIYESIWENKEVVFTCLILPYFAAIYLDIKDRKEKLSLEHYYYNNFKILVAKFVIFFKKNIDDYNMIITKNEIEDELKNPENFGEVSFENLFKDMNELLIDMIKSAKNGGLECDLSYLFEKLKSKNNNIYKNYKKHLKISIDDVNEFQYTCNAIFNNISWIWKRDSEINKKIIKLIEQ